MSLTARWGLIGLALLLPGVFSSSAAEGPLPAVHKPKTPVSKADLNRREARRLYALGCLHEKNNRLIEAVKVLEEAARLDPDTVAIPRALYPLYFAVDRTSDGLEACARVLRLDPDDYQTAYHQARQLRTHDRLREAAASLEKATRSSRLKDRPDLAAQIWFDLGVMRENESDWAKAEAAFRQVVKLLDNSAALIDSGRYSREEVVSQAADTLERLGKICLKAKKIDDAIVAFEEARKKDELRGPRLAYNLAQVYRDQGKFREALLSLDQYLRSLPQGTEGYEMKISLQRKLGRTADVLPHLEAASGRDPNNVALRLLLAREYHRAERHRLAEPIYVKLLETDPTPEVYRGLFALHKDQGKRGIQTVLGTLDGALRDAAGDEKTPANPSAARRARAMLAVLRDDPDLVRALLPVAVRESGRPRLSYATRGTLAAVAAKAKLSPEAEALFRSCLERHEGFGVPQAEVYVGLLLVLRAQHKHAEIVEVCQRGLKHAQNTDRLLFHNELVWAYQALGKHKEALASAEAGVTDADKRQMLRCKRIWIDALVQAGQHAKALAECHALIKEYNHGGDLRNARATLSSVLQSMGRHDEAEEQLLLILKSDPNDVTANNDLGYVWADRNKNLAEAERLIRKALELDRQLRATGLSVSSEADRDNAAYVDSLGWVLFRRGKLQEAKEQLERASRMPGGDDDPVVWDHLGDVCHRLKQPDRAAECWKKALSLYDVGTRRKTDGRVKDIQEKLRLIKP